MAEEREGEGFDDLDRPPAFFPYGAEPEEEAAATIELIECQIEGVFAAEQNGNISRFVLLTDGLRKLPISIGPFEAQAIQMILEGTRPERPLTHDLFRNVLDRLEGTLDRIAIDDVWNGVFYAKLYVRHGENEWEIDARPSDAIALAMRFDAPIYVTDAILDRPDL